MRSQQQAVPQQGYYGAAANVSAGGYGAPAAYGMYPTGGPEGGDGQQQQARGGVDASAVSAGYAAAAEQQQQQQAQQGGQYGAYRGQAAAQGRVDRSYRPY